MPEGEPYSEVVCWESVDQDGRVPYDVRVSPALGSSETLDCEGADEYDP